MSNPSSSLATTQQQALLSPDAWKVMREQADMLVKSGLLPQAVNKPEAAIAIMMTGAEFGFTPMQSFRLINVIKGKPTLSADGMAALVIQHCERRGDGYLKVVESDNDHATVEYRRPGEQEAHRTTFTVEDAKRAGLMDNPQWQKYPKNMCVARAKANGSREGFPDVVGGVYDPDELMAPGPYTEAAGRVVAMDTRLTHEVGMQVPASAYSIDDLQESGYRIAELAPAAAPRTTQSEWQVPDDPAVKERAMKRIHAVGAKVGISHEILHEKAVKNGKDSVADYTADQLSRIADRIEASGEEQLFNEWSPYGWLAPAPAADPETGEVIIEVSPNPEPIEEEAQRSAAKQTLWYAARDEWGWSLDDLQAVATYNGDKPLSDYSLEQYHELFKGLVNMNPAERAAELRSAREALGVAA